MTHHRWLAAWWIGCAGAVALAADRKAADAPPRYPGCTGAYGLMYWLDGVRAPGFVIGTSRYAMSYDHRLPGPVALGALHTRLPEAAAHQAPVPAVPPVAFSCVVHANSAIHRARPASDDPRTSMIVESGRMFQRRWQTFTVPGVACDPERSGLELSAWPDRLALQFRFCPQSAVVAGTLEMTIGLGSGWKRISGVTPITVTGPDGAGYVCLPAHPGDTLSFDADECAIRVKSATRDWPANSHPVTGIALHPATEGLEQLAAELASAQAAPATVRAVAVEPAAGPLQVRYEPAHDWHRITLPRGTPGDDGRMRAHLSLHNPGATKRIVRLMFDGVPFYVPGISAVLCDSDGFPNGVPVQLSKNWHGKPAPADHPAGFSGEWFHGISMVGIDAGSTLELELLMVGENWGGMPAASHAQLSTIGYGGNQQWDQSALGNRGEALCYDMDHVLTDNCFTDSRPFGMTRPGGGRGWNINIGGGSVLRLHDATGAPLHHQRMRVRCVRGGPNLTEAVFTGETAGGAIAFSYSASLFRADDCTRGFHRIVIRAKRDTGFGNLAIYQQAGESYHYNQGSTLSWGDAARPDPIRIWQASGRPGLPVGEVFPLEGPDPWMAVTGGPAEAGYHPANHGFIIRSWKARLGGRDIPSPFARERRTHGDVSILELVPPPGLDRLQRDDFVELELARIYVPQSAATYAGTNGPFREALKRFPDDPRMILREAAGNRIRVKTVAGRLVRGYPPVIEASANRAQFQLQGGIGALPVTFTGLTDHRNPVLERNTPRGWVPADPQAIGRDSWQCDYDESSSTWEITFTLRPDEGFRTPSELIASPETREYRFRSGPATNP